MKKLFVLLSFLFILSLHGQTKLIAHKSHSGTFSNFRMDTDGNLGLIINVFTLDEETDSTSINKLTDENINSPHKPYSYRINTKEGISVSSKKELNEYKKFRHEYIESAKEPLSTIIINEYKEAWNKHKKESIKRSNDSVNYIQDSIQKKKENIIISTPNPPKDQTSLMIGILSIVLIFVSFIIWKVEIKTQKAIL